MRSYQADLSDCEVYAAEKAVVQGAAGAVVAATLIAIFDGGEGASRCWARLRGPQEA